MVKRLSITQAFLGETQEHRKPHKHSQHSALAALDASKIRVLVWNVAKGRYQGWAHDLQALAHSADLAILQEVRLEHQLDSLFGEPCCVQFAEGYRHSRSVTGVMTLSRSRACGLTAHQLREPWIRTPKAALLTEYPLMGSEETLQVINIHAINFSAGLGSYRRQLDSLHSFMAQAPGPKIFAGDFNAWRSKRSRLLTDMMRDAGLQHIAFPVDQRKKVLGHALDHIFVRGLDYREPGIRNLRSSDHNPLQVTLSLAETA